MNKKRILAIFGIIIMLCTTVLSAFPTFAGDDISTIVDGVPDCPTCATNAFSAFIRYDTFDNETYHDEIYWCDNCDSYFDTRTNCTYSVTNTNGEIYCDDCFSKCPHNDMHYGCMPDDPAQHMNYGTCQTCGWYFDMYTENCTFVNGACKCGNFETVTPEETETETETTPIETPCEHPSHRYTYTYVDENKCRWVVSCVDCHKVFSDAIIKHHFSNGVCECGFVLEVTPEETETETETTPIETPCEHSSQKYTYTYVDESKCRWVVSCFDCNEVISDSIIEHHFLNGVCDCGFICSHKSKEIDYQPMSNGTHSFVENCSVCNIEIRRGTENCNIVNGICSNCGNGCTHSETEIHYVIKSATKHTVNKACIVCSYILESTVSNCEYFGGICKYCENACVHPTYSLKYTTVGNGSHRCYYTCQVCSLVYNESSEKCTYVENVCSKCGDKNETPIIPNPDDVTGDYTDGYNDGYAQAFKDFYKAPIMNCTYSVVFNVTDLKLNTTLDMEYFVDIKGLPSNDFNYIVGDGLLLRDIYRLAMRISLDDNGVNKAIINNVTIKLAFKDAIKYSDSMMFFSVYDGFEGDITRYFNIFAIKYIDITNNELLTNVVKSGTENRYNITIPLASHGDIYVKSLEFNFPVEKLANSQFITLWFDQVDETVDLISYNKGYSNGLNVGKDKAYSAGYDDAMKKVNDEKKISYEQGYNKGYNNGVKGKNSFYDLITATYDSMTNFFFNIFSFEILGVNLASLISALITVPLLIFAIKILH